MTEPTEPTTPDEAPEIPVNSTLPALPLYNGVDSARPGNPLPAGTQILAAYVGIPGIFGPDTPHIWTADEWNHYISSDPDLRVLPVYTHNFPGNPIGDANNACDAIERLGWAPGLQGAERRILAVDLEIMINPMYVSALFAQVMQRGFSPMPYGSRAFVSQNPQGPVGYWVAELLRVAPIVLPPNAAGVQWKWTDTWDYDVFNERVYLGCGRGLRHAG